MAREALSRGRPASERREALVLVYPASWKKEASESRTDSEGLSVETASERFRLRAMFVDLQRHAQWARDV
jgi:hypothetical protein